MDRLNAMHVFEQVVAQSGFAAAARKLDLAPATVTRLVSDLEGHLGVRLLQRTTRRLALTAAGEVYLDRVRAILSEVDEAEEEARNSASEVSGCVRVLALPGLATHLVAPAIADFRRLHPKVTIEIESDPLAARGIGSHDLTLLTNQIAVSGDVVVRPLADSQNIFCASPDYLDRHGVPLEPGDLPRHSFVRIVLPGISRGPIQVEHESKAGQRSEVEVDAIVTCNDHEAVLRATLEGAGISSQATEVAAPFLKSGRLRRVLQPWLSERFTLVAAFVSRRHMPARTRAFLDHLVASAARLGAGPGAGALKPA
jgi:DNA-binding transcriptional LysR family regulator